MRVPAKLTRPLTSRLSVFGFQTRNTRPKPIVYPYQRSITIFRPDPARSSRYPTKSRPDLDRFGQISVRSRWIRPYFGQISNDPVRFRPDLAGSGQISSPVINPKPIRINPKPTRPEPKIQPDLRVGFGSIFYSPAPFGSSSGWAQTRPGLTRGHPYTQDH